MSASTRIRILDQMTVGKIAAGEVIERPASVVKELVENSLDAGASWIAVEVSDAGCSRITVRDDGAGIESADLALALQRHGTSKLRSAEDLRSVATLGFRGEGLASIAAAARSLRLTSRTAGQEFGATIEARSAALSEVTKTSSPPGTTVDVEELFAATPVRRAFLKSHKAESARIASLLAHIALGWPQVAFSFRQDGRDVWSLPATEQALDRAELVFGHGSRGALVPVISPVAERVRVEGLTSKVGSDRSNRHGQIIFVNRRLVNSPELSAAWSAGYTSMIMTGRYPYGVLMVTVPDDDVDVNVHPAKTQVRFRDGQALFDAARRAVRSAVAHSGPGEPAVRVAQPAPLLSQGTPALSLLRAIGEDERSSGTAHGGGNGEALRPLGQIDRTFILISEGGELVVVDQHAAHERIAFEFLLRRSKGGAPPTPLLFPLVYELTPGQIETLHRCESELVAAGIDVEPFGDGAYRIAAIPESFGRRRFDFVAMLDVLSRDDGAADEESHRRRVLATVACHSVVRAHEPLALQEQLTLYERLKECDEPQTCPHGRPTILRLDAEHLAKAFRRT